MITQLAYGSTIFDPTSGFFRLKGEVTGLDYPDVRSGQFNRPAQRGIHRTRSIFGSRKIGINFMIYATDLVTYRLQRRTLLVDLNAEDDPKTLYITTSDGEMYQIDAFVSSVDLPEKVVENTWVDCRIELECEDPIIIGQTENEQLAAPSITSGGAPVPAPVPLAVGVTTLFNSVFHNDGNVNADVVWRLSAPGTNFIVTNLTTGESFSLTLTLATGEYVDIDTKLGTVIQGGITDRSDSFAGDFPILAPGDNTLSFIVGSGTSAETTLRGTWRDSYSGI